MVTRSFRAMNRLLKNTRGGILSLTMITLPLMLTMVALVVDIGILYLAKSKTEMAALEAAESAYLRLPDIAAAESLARKVVMAHISDVGYVRSSSITATATASDITVAVDLETSTFFAGIIGINTLDVSSTVTRP